MSPFFRCQDVVRLVHFHHWVVAGDSVGCGSLWLKMVEPEVIQHLKDLGHTVDLSDSSPGQWQKRGEGGMEIDSSSSSSSSSSDSSWESGAPWADEDEDVPAQPSIF